MFFQQVYSSNNWHRSHLEFQNFIIANKNVYKSFFLITDWYDVRAYISRLEAKNQASFKPFKSVTLPDSYTSFHLLFKSQDYLIHIKCNVIMFGIFLRAYLYTSKFLPCTFETLRCCSFKLYRCCNVGLKAKPLEKSVFTTHICNCWCTQWAEVHIRRSTGNFSWMMRIQNEQVIILDTLRNELQ